MTEARRDRRGGALGGVAVVVIPGVLAKGALTHVDVRVGRQRWERAKLDGMFRLGVGSADVAPRADLASLLQLVKARDGRTRRLIS